MFTTTLVVALAGFVASTAVGSPRWHADYNAAQKLGREGSKPLAVFISSGRAGWNRICQEGELGKEVKQLLAKNYICVYIDTDLQSGRELASAFEIPNGVGMVISDHSGRYEAYHHRGDLPNERLLHYLSRYADPDRVVRATETNPAEPENYYPVESYPATVPLYYQPIRSAPMFFGRSAGGC